jgi:ribosome-associated protein
MPSAKDTLLLHQAEQWRDRLIADEDAVGQWIALSPTTDSQNLRALVRQARKDAKPEKPGLAPRHGRAYRDIFQLVREALTSAQEQPEPSLKDADGYAGNDA